MSKILILNSGLSHSHEYLSPYIERLQSYLKKTTEVVDVRNVRNFDERTFFEYDQIVFVFMVAMNSIPSTTLEIFEKLKTNTKPHQQIYALILSDEYECEKCDYAHKVLSNWCKRENLFMKGTLKIGSALVIMDSAHKFVTSNRIKQFADVIVNKEDAHLSDTLFSEKTFLTKANQYWNKEIKRYREKGE